MSMDRDGFVVVEKFFSNDEINELRAMVDNHLNRDGGHFIYHNSGKVISNAFEYVQDLYKKVVTKKLAEVLKQELGDIVYLHHSDVHYNMFNGWHKDVAEKYVPGIFTDASIYDRAKIFKVGIYLQDCTNNKIGLTVRKGSHKHLDNTGDEFYISSSVGDILIFDQRLYHRGFYPTDEYLQIASEIDAEFPDPSRALEEKFIVFQKLRKDHQNEKFSIFVGFGADDDISLRFANGIIARQNIQNNINYERPSTHLLNYFNSIGIPYAKTWEE